MTSQIIKIICEEILQLDVDYLIWGKFHSNICTFKIFKGVGKFAPPWFK